MDIFLDVLPYIVNPITGIVCWFAGRRKRDNGMLNEQQASLAMLLTEQKSMLTELVEVRKENASLLHNQKWMKLEMESLRKENASLKEQVESLNEKLSNVRTITRNKI